MPSLRGIEVSLTAQFNGQRIPEYPHPEGACVRLYDDPKKDASGGSPRIYKPTISVYVPSAPGSPFSIEYGVNSVPPRPCKYIYFKLFINGRHMASWTVDPAVQRSGRLDKSFWAPSGAYSEAMGLEARHFVFLPGQENKSIAEDGGLIEVQVFRSKNRWRRAPRVEEFRGRENYRIASPSVGLVEESQKISFFMCELVDPPKAPFATFCLHYRSTESLRHISLIPSRYSQRAPMPLEEWESNYDLAIQSNLVDDSKPQETNPSYKPVCFGQEIFGNDTPGSVRAGSSETLQAEYVLKCPPEQFPTSSGALDIPQPSKAARDAAAEPYLQRPLPEIPVEDIALLSRRVSVSSTKTASSASSMFIAPSLKGFIDDESFGPDAFEIRSFEVVQMCPPKGSLEFTALDRADDLSESDYDASPQSTNGSDGSGTQGIPSPGRYLPTTRSMMEMHCGEKSPEHELDVQRALDRLWSPPPRNPQRLSRYQSALPLRSNPPPVYEVPRQTQIQPTHSPPSGHGKHTLLSHQSDTPLRTKPSPENDPGSPRRSEQSMDSSSSNKSRYKTHLARFISSVILSDSEKNKTHSPDLHLGVQSDSESSSDFSSSGQLYHNHISRLHSSVTVNDIRFTRDNPSPTLSEKHLLENPRKESRPTGGFSLGKYLKMGLESPKRISFMIGQKTGRKSPPKLDSKTHYPRGSKSQSEKIARNKLSKAEDWKSRSEKNVSSTATEGLPHSGTTVAAAHSRGWSLGEKAVSSNYVTAGYVEASAVTPEFTGNWI